MLLCGISDQIINSELDTHMKKIEQTYSDYNKINVHIVTWNVNGKVAQNNLKNTIFNFFGNTTPEVIVVGL